MIRRLPIRVRLTLPFALAMALVLAATGAFIYLRVSRALLTNVDQTLRAQAEVWAPRVQAGKPLVDPDDPRIAPISQLLSPTGAVVSQLPAGLPAFLSARQLATVRAGRVLRESVDDRAPGLEGPWRLRAVPVTVGGRRDVLVLGASLADRAETLDRLRVEFLLAAPAALLLATIAGYLLAAASLHPVEAIRRRAAAVTASTPGTRVPVPPTRDEIARLAETLNDMLARLEAAFAHERRFVADASHELRTPLALLRTELELALRRPRSAEALERALRSAAEETERLNRLAEDLLLIARSDQGPLPVRSEPTSARDVMATVVERFSLRADRLGRPVQLAGGEDVVVEADPVRLEQALGNLVENALAYGAGVVELSVVSRTNTVEFHVTDEGPGFRADFLEQAFARFSRADDARSGGGTGLGLAIVDVIAVAHGGRAAAANRPEGGADVWLELPRVPEPARPLLLTL